MNIKERFEFELRLAYEEEPQMSSDERWQLAAERTEYAVSAYISRLVEDKKAEHQNAVNKLRFWLLSLGSRTF